MFDKLKSPMPHIPVHEAIAGPSKIKDALIFSDVRWIFVTMWNCFTVSVFL